MVKLPTGNRLASQSLGFLGQELGLGPIGGTNGNRQNESFSE